VTLADSNAILHHLNGRHALGGPCRSRLVRGGAAS
jgi:hypothetical protein